LVAALLLLACSAGSVSAPPRDRTGNAKQGASTVPGDAATEQPSPDAAPSEPAPTRQPFLPAPDRPLPREPEPLADLLTRTTRSLRRSIEAWAPGGTPSTARPPEDVVLLALHQQRIYRLLGRDSALAAATIDRLPGWLAGEARANTTAAAGLFSLVTPISSSSGFLTEPPPPAGELLVYYREAERRFGVDWEVLAAVHHVETKFSRVRSASTAGAQGPMQFIASTWDAYGLGGDVHDDHDAILGAANYLQASGAPESYRNALYNYNHAWEYVDSILAYARQMMRDPRDFFAYYNWQVFVLTTTGDQRLTGPGLD
jgi:hypothetical protein